MAADDTVRNRTKQARGKTKEVVGSTLGDRSLERSGKKDMVDGEIRQRGSKIKDALS